MHKPRLLARLAVALIAFVIGISGTLLFNYLRPAPRVGPSALPVIVTRQLGDAPPAHAPCGARGAALQPAFAWTPDAPPPPPPPRPRQRTR